MGYLNIGSLVLGLIAWMLPIANLARRGEAERGTWAILSIASLIACSLSLFCVIVYLDHLAKIEDWSAIMDTSGAFVLASTVLIAGTVALNAIMLSRYHGIGENRGDSLHARCRGRQGNGRERPFERSSM